MVVQLALLNAAQAQVPNAGLPHVIEYPLPHQTVLLEFNQDECQTSVTEEYVIPDVPANPSSVALTMLFNTGCDLGLSTANTVPMAVMGPSTADKAPLAHRAQREIIEEYLVSPDSLRTVVKFGE